VDHIGGSSLALVCLLTYIYAPCHCSYCLLLTLFHPVLAASCLPVARAPQDSVDTATAERVFQFFTEQALGNGMFLTNWLDDNEYGMFLRPARSLPTGEKTRPVGGRDGKDGPWYYPNGPSQPRQLWLQYVFDVFILPYGRMLMRSLTKFGTTLLERRRLFLVLDIDQTLLHCSKNVTNVAPPDICTIEGIPYRIQLRPGVCNFLRQVAKRYVFAFLTMGNTAYAEAIKEYVHCVLQHSEQFAMCLRCCS
jgi:hypothetical protein